MRTERWCFTDAELKDPKTCRADDEFMVTIPEEESELPVIIYRNGDVSNRYADGTVGVSESNRAMADAEETPYTLDGENYADNWRDVVVNNDGGFHAFVGCLPDHDNIRYCRSLKPSA